MSVLYITEFRALLSPLWMHWILDRNELNYIGLRLTTEFGYDCPDRCISANALENLVHLMVHFKIVHLQCQNVDFNAITSTEGKLINLKGCSSLKTIELIDCTKSTRLIVRAVCDCPLLESVNTRGNIPSYMSSFDIQYQIMAKNLNKNCRLRHFAMREVTAYFTECTYSGLRIPVDNSVNENRVIAYQKFIQQIIDRNSIGWINCRQAIYQLYLIKRHGNSPLFACLNRDVVNIIARLLYQSRFKEAWCPLLKFP